MWKTHLFFIALFGIVASTFIFPALADQFVFENPIAANSFQELVLSLTRTLAPLILTVAAVAIIIVGFQFVIAAAKGDVGGIGKAKANLYWVLIGTAVVVGAYAIASAVVNTLKGL